MKSNMIAALLICLLLVASGTERLFAQSITSKVDISSVGSGEKETTLGDLTADALRDTAGSDVAFVPSSAIRSTSLPAAGLQAGELGDVLIATTAPANAYVVMRLKGRQILAALERSVSHLPQSFDGYLQVSGIKVTYDPSKPEGSRIVSVVLPSGAALSPDSQYVAAMTQPLGIGGMGYFQAWNQSDIVRTSDVALSTVLVNYSLAHQPLTIETDGRLTSQ